MRCTVCCEDDRLHHNEDGRSHNEARKYVLDIRICPLNFFCYKPFSNNSGFLECRFSSLLFVIKTVYIHYLPTPYFRLSVKQD